MSTHRYHQLDMFVLMSESRKWNATGLLSNVGVVLCSGRHVWGNEGFRYWLLETDAGQTLAELRAELEPCLVFDQDSVGQLGEPDCEWARGVLSEAILRGSVRPALTVAFI